MTDDGYLAIVEIVSEEHRTLRTMVYLAYIEVVMQEQRRRTRLGEHQMRVNKQVVQGAPQMTDDGYLAIVEIVSEEQRRRTKLSEHHFA